MSKNSSKKIKNKSSKPNHTIVSTIGIIIFALIFCLIGYFIQKATPKVKDEIPEDKIDQKNISHLEDVSWEDFTSSSLGFKASFPGHPIHKVAPVVSENLNPPGFNRTTESYTTESSDGVVYAVNLSDFSDCPNKTDTLEDQLFMQEFFLEIFIHEILIDSHSELVSSSFSTFGPHKAIDFLIHKKDTDTYTKGKNILVGKKLYQVMTTYESKNSSIVEFDKLLDSFEIL